MKEDTVCGHLIRLSTLLIGKFCQTISSYIRCHCRVDFRSISNRFCYMHSLHIRSWQSHHKKPHSEDKKGTTLDKTCTLYSNLNCPLCECSSTTLSQQPFHPQTHTVPGLRIGKQQKSPKRKKEPPGPKAEESKATEKQVAKTNAQNSSQRLADVYV